MMVKPEEYKGAKDGYEVVIKKRRRIH